MLRRKAFTLVELLVVIAVIGLLSTVAVMATNSSRIQSRNARRIADIKQLMNAFYLGYDAAGSYPDSSASPSGFACVSSSCGGGWGAQTQNANVNTFLNPFLPNKPADPTGGSRAYSGYLFAGAWAGGASPFDGYVFPAGAYLDFMQETAPGASCGPGRKYATYGAYSTECLVPLNQ